MSDRFVVSFLALPKA